jgi:hypothetical protein
MQLLQRYASCVYNVGLKINLVNFEILMRRVEKHDETKTAGFNIL